MRCRHKVAHCWLFNDSYHTHVLQDSCADETCITPRQNLASDLEVHARAHSSEPPRSNDCAAVPHTTCSNTKRSMCDTEQRQMEVYDERGLDRFGSHADAHLACLTVFADGTILGLTPSGAELEQHVDGRMIEVAADGSYTEWDDGVEVTIRADGTALARTTSRCVEWLSNGTVVEEASDGAYTEWHDGQAITVVPSLNTGKPDYFFAQGPIERH